MQRSWNRGYITVYARTLDVLIIGAGQAGLALGFHLKKTPFRFQLVDSHARVGDSWRKRYASLVLFTPRAYSALPGLAVPGDPDGYPTKDEMADYLETYARHFNILLQLAFSASWQFLWAGSYHNTLWRRVKLGDLGRGAGG